MEKISKKRKEVLNKTNVDKIYALDEAIDIVKENAKSKFNETLDIAVNLSLNSGKSENNIKGIISLPNGIGKKLKVAVIVESEKSSEAKESGADIVGDKDLLKSIEQGNINFDRLISTPLMMKEVGKLGKILGPKGLMPNPKLGTVSNNVSKAVKDAKEGQIQFKNDKSGIIHAAVGKVSFEKTKLIENIKAFIKEIIKNKPDSIKGNFIKKVSIASTMGIGIKLNVSELQKLWFLNSNIKNLVFNVMSETVGAEFWLKISYVDRFSHLVVLHKGICQENESFDIIINL